ncbi:hypothetical protein [Mameliella alba]|uniref:hypothetical protein n=1 Tax=Mameliella alba TaxID=561184 RepID=UPI000B52BA88|nr:hypothetical protein [Mameliella alba]OWV40385.1 hypothetical protein CDZ95_21395 [Mameliella alba]
MAAGQDPAALWGYCPREIDHILRGAAYRDQAQAWLAGRYGAVGFHHPQDFPNAPKLIDFAPPASGVEAEIAAIRRRVRVEHDTRQARGDNGN